MDDGSKDGTRDILTRLAEELKFKLIFQPQNGGKGAALRRGFQEVTGDLVIIQDADLEYSPEEFPQLIELICQGRADVVYGSRFLGRHRVFLFTHYAGNRFLTLVTNVLYNTMLSDMETCYKVMRTEVLRSMTLESDGFGIEPELTAKIFKRHYRVYEVPITYDGRGLRGREEDHLARRLRRALGAAEISVHRVNPLPRLLGYSRRYKGRFAVAFAAMLLYAARIGGRGLPDQADHRRGPAADRHRRARCPIRGRWCSGPGAILVAYLAKGLGAYFSAYLMTDIGQRVVRDLRDQLFKHILDQSAAFFSRWSTGPLMSRITNDVNQVQQAVSETVGRSAARRAGARRLRRRCCSTGTPGSPWSA